MNICCQSPGKGLDIFWYRICCVRRKELVSLLCRCRPAGIEQVSAGHLHLYLRLLLSLCKMELQSTFDILIDHGLDLRPVFFVCFQHHPVGDQTAIDLKIKQGIRLLPGQPGVFCQIGGKAGPVLTGELFQNPLRGRLVKDQRTVPGIHLKLMAEGMGAGGAAGIEHMVDEPGGVFKDIFNECIQHVIGIIKMQIEGTAADTDPLAELGDGDSLEGGMLHHFQQSILDGLLRIAATTVFILCRVSGHDENLFLYRFRKVCRNCTQGKMCRLPGEICQIIIKSPFGCHDISCSYTVKISKQGKRRMKYENDL